MAQPVEPPEFRPPHWGEQPSLVIYGDYPPVAVGRPCRATRQRILHIHDMAWVILVVSGLLEAGWALSLKASDGLSKLWPSVAFFVLLAASMAGLMIALKTLPVGPAYAVWVGIGA